MSKKYQILWWLLVIILLAPILLYPLSPDTSIYLETGRIIADGGKIYVDSVDLKQPLIYYIFAFINLIFGYSEFSIRLFDFIWQLATIVSLFFLLRKTINIKTAYLSSLIYAVSYTVLNYSQTMQCESFVGLPIVWLIYLRPNHSDEFLYLLILGFLIGIIGGFKFTLLLIYFAVIFDLVLSQDTFIRLLKKILILSAGTLLGIFVSMSPLLDKEIFNGYVNVLKYLSYYSSMSSFNFDSLKIMIKSTGVFFGDRFSLPFTVSFFAGIYLMMKKYISINYTLQTDTVQNDFSNNCNKEFRLINLSFLLIAFLYISVMWEGKFWDYHISRMYVPLIIVTGFGMNMILENISKMYKSESQYLKLIIIIICLLGILFSPLSRWANTVRSGYYYFANTEIYDSFYNEVISDKTVPLRMNHKEIANIVNSKMKKNDFVMVISTGSNAINYFLATNKVSAFRNSQFIFNPLQIKDWRRFYINELNTADWIIIQTDDSREEIIGQDLSSFDLFLMDAENLKNFNMDFQIFEQVGNFLIFRRKSNGTEN